MQPEDTKGGKLLLRGDSAYEGIGFPIRRQEEVKLSGGNYSVSGQYQLSDEQILENEEGILCNSKYVKLFEHPVCIAAIAGITEREKIERETAMWCLAFLGMLYEATPLTKAFKPVNC